jgi:hypothetical protein
MYNRNIARIEFSPEIEPLLKVLAEKANCAHTAILYKFINKDDLEGTELLDLLSNSQMVSNNKDEFYEDVLNEDWSSKIQELISKYEQGDLSINNEDLNKLKDEISVLRFNEYYESKNKNNPQRYNFDYTKRPQKYLVLSDEILNEPYKRNNSEGFKQIKEEGVTAYICRAEGNAKLQNKKGKFFEFENTIIPNDLLKVNLAHCNASDKDIDFKIYGHDAAWTLLKDKGKVIGCLRFEYNTKKESTNKLDNIDNHGSEKNLNTIPSLKNDLELIVLIIKEVLINREEFSYSELYGCLTPVLKQIVDIGLELRKNIYNKTNSNNNEDDETIKSSHYMIEHLYYVFKRNTYYGELIYDRINKFIEALFKNLGLNENIFLELWNSLRKQEDLMLYDLENYRDHFIHQFHVFITGYIFINKFGIEKLRKILISNYENQNNKNIDISKITKTDVLRIWVLTSLFHDCGYSFEKLAKGHETFSVNIINVKLDSNFQWDKLILDDTYITGSLQNIAKYFNCCPKNLNFFGEPDLLRILLKNAIIKNDHGVISSIILKQQYKSCNMEIEIPLINFIIDISALSIALHNRPVFLNLSKEYNQSICFHLNPFASILAYFDTAQEWGRKKSDKQNNILSPPELTEITLSDKEFTMFLEYKPSNKGKRPTKEFINSNLYDVKNSFVSDSNMIFSIKHNIGTSAEKTEFKNCGSCKYYENCNPLNENEKKEK